jgi:UDP-hydrolysing UDP-N-acetyl-D-glucosamine 2-epimerase
MNRDAKFGQKRICVVTGSRADFDLYQPLLAALDRAPGYAPEIAVTGMHLAPDLGSTIDTVEALGLPISGRVESLLAGDTPSSIAKSCGLGVIGFADLWRHDPPDLVFVLGDRYEIFAAAQAAYLSNLPIAHIAGGDVTNGSKDDGMRHAITKLSHLHFPTNQVASTRLLQMGEDPARVHMVGSPAIDVISKFQALSVNAIEQRLNWKWREKTLLVTLHPDTSGGHREFDELSAMLDAFDALDGTMGLVITLPNADAGGRAVTAKILEFADGREATIARPSLGRELYLSCMTHCAAVIGNSSSGLYEAPSFGVPTVNIGDRQDGRIKASSVIDVAPRADRIGAAIQRALEMGDEAVENPYGDGNTAPRIISILDQITDYGALTRKSFHDLGNTNV